MSDDKVDDLLSGPTAGFEGPRRSRGQPPIYGRFKKGQSGNPAGRPPRRSARPDRRPSPQADQSWELGIQQNFLEVIEVTQNGKTSRRNLFEVTAMNLVRKALTGDMKAFSEISACLDQPADSAVPETQRNVRSPYELLMFFGVETMSQQLFNAAEIDSYRRWFAPLPSKLLKTLEGWSPHFPKVEALSIINAAGDPVSISQGELDERHLLPSTRRDWNNVVEEAPVLKAYFEEESNAVEQEAQEEPAPQPPTSRHQGAVGYKKPPVAHQFQPGTSGNPRGRRPRPTSLAEALSIELARPINSISKPKLTQFAALQRVLVLQAAKSNSKALANARSALNSNPRRG